MEQTARVGNRTAYEWLAALPAFLVLVFVVILNTSHTIHAQLLQVGESIWDGYFQLRHDPVQPSCDRNINVDTALARSEQELIEKEMMASSLADSQAQDAAAEEARLVELALKDSVEEAMGATTSDRHCIQA